MEPVDGSRRDIPSVDRVASIARSLGFGVPDRMLVRAVRRELDELRQQSAAGVVPELDIIANSAAASALALMHDAPRRVINATGIIVHTNLGRAPLSDRALQAVVEAGGGYSNLEFDLVTGDRGSRSTHISDVVREVTGAEAALVVNNNAAGVFLALDAHASAREVLVSRGEAIEIGGGFRIPEILSASGAILRDVGTTNRTRLSDYAGAITPRTAAILRVHRSNFAQVGFTESARLEDLAALARERGLLLIDDLGSGSLIDTSPFGLAHEPLVQESLAEGASVVCFSGDKLLGGPQAGVLVGARSAIDPIARRPLARAMRPDKMTIAALRTTFGHYLRGDALSELPVWQMIAATPAAIRERAERIAENLPGLSIRPTESAVGGGALPGQALPSWAVCLAPSSDGLDAMATRLRRCLPPVVGRIHDGLLWLDIRTVLLREESDLQRALAIVQTE